MKFKFEILNLQLFAEGGASASAAPGEGATGVNATVAAPQAKGVKSNPLSGVVYGKQTDVPNAGGQTITTDASGNTTQTVDRNAEFEKLIKGDYKDLYDARVQDTIQRRLKGTKETVDRFNALSPTIEMLAKKYGVRADDIAALNKAIEEDDTYYEDEALEKGITVQQLKEIRKMEKENATLKKQMQEQESRENANRLYATWMQQTESAKAIYPSIDLRSEMANPQFANLLRNNVDVKTAYEVVHKDEILPAAMQFAAKTVEKKLTDKIIANGARPAENGMSSQSAAVVKNDVTKLSKADRAEIIRRVQRGEKISF